MFFSKTLPLDQRRLLLETVVILIFILRSPVTQDKKVGQKIDFVESRFGVLRSHGFKKNKYYFSSSKFIWADTGGHCKHHLGSLENTKQNAKLNTYSNRVVVT